jgi:hypothetical protein
VDAYLAFTASHLSQGFYIQQGLPLVDGKLNVKAFKPATENPIQVRGNFQMTASSRVRNEGLVILHFLLVGLDPAGSPARLLKEYMCCYLDKGSLLYEEITFDLGNDALIREYHQTLKSLERRIK